MPTLPEVHKRMDIVDTHIVLKCRGNIDVLAHKLKLSRAMTYKVIAYMKEEGFPIEYSKKEKLHYYSVPGRKVGYVFVRDTDDTASSSSKNSGGGGKK